MSNWIGLAASIGAVILSVVCILLIWAWRRLATLQAQVDSLSSAVNSFRTRASRFAGSLHEFAKVSKSFVKSVVRYA
jgi:hypothetical protein